MSYNTAVIFKIIIRDFFFFFSEKGWEGQFVFVISRNGVIELFELCTFFKLYIHTHVHCDEYILYQRKKNLVHLPRKNWRGGGIGLLFRSTFQLLSHKPTTTGTFECINVTLRCQRTKVNLQLIVVYRPPSSSLPRAFVDDFTQRLNNVVNTVNETIICGDFNIKYNNSQSTDVASFADLLDCAGFIQHVTDSTHVSGNVLDLIITHRCSNIITSPVIPTTLLTDHHAVECELRYGKPTRQTHRVQYRKYSSIDQKAFTEDVHSMFATNLEKPVDCFAAYQDAVTDAETVRCDEYSAWPNYTDSVTLLD